MKKSEKALKNVSSWVEEKKRYLYVFSNKYQKRKLIREDLNKMKKITKWGWVWNFINGLYWCKTPIESHVFCGLKLEELENLTYYKKIGGIVK